MKNLNWKLRAESPAFWVGLAGVILSPVLTYFGLVASDLTTWYGLWDLATKVVTNPYLLGVIFMSVASFLGIAVDHTTSGLSDSKQALTYTTRKKDEE